MKIKNFIRKLFCILFILTVIFSLYDGKAYAYNNAVGKRIINKIINDFDVSSYPKLNTKTLIRSTNAQTEITGNIKISLSGDDFIEIKDNKLINLKQTQEIQKGTSQVSKFLDSNNNFSEVKLEKYLRDKNYINDDFILYNSYNPIDTMWKATFIKKSKYGCINKYNSVKVSVDTVSGKIIFYSKDESYKDDIKPQITKDEAILIANKYFTNGGFDIVKDMELMIVNDDIISSEKTYNPLKFYLAYKGETAQAWIYVDALSGKVLSVSGKEAMFNGKSFYINDDGFEYFGRWRKTRAGYLRDILNLLGYSSNRVYISKDKTGKTNILNYLASSYSKAFTFSGHGAPTVIGASNDSLTIHYYDVKRSMKFVFLDACTTGPNPFGKSKRGNSEKYQSYWAQRFNKDKSGIFLGWNSTVTGSVSKEYLGNLYKAVKINPKSSFYKNVWTAINSGSNNYYIGFYGNKNITGRVR